MDLVTEYLESSQSIIRYFLAFVIISNFLLIFCLTFSIRIKRKFVSMMNIKSIKEDIHKVKTTLIITAHPDDEAMFYSPMLKYLTELNCKIKILCLSTGNYDGIGSIREEEFRSISKELRMEDNAILDHKDLQDHFSKKWNDQIVSEQIKAYIDNNKDIGTIITFDENGVTKHPNHISCYDGLVYYLKENREEIKKEGIQVYLLDSFSFISQYTFILPFIYFYFKEHGYFNSKLMFPYRLMQIYKSQFKLFRKVHVLISCYSYLNSFTKIELK